MLLRLSRIKSLASLLGFDDFEPFPLNLGARRRAADHAETAVNEPDHVVQVAVTIGGVLEVGADFLRHAMINTHCFSDVEPNYYPKLHSHWFAASPIP